MDLIYRYDPFQPVVATAVPDSAAAGQALRQGNERFVEIVRRMQERTLGAKEGEPIVIPVSPVSLGLPILPGMALKQAPFALVLGCSDARAPVEAIFDQSFNDLFVVRIAGNVLGTECLGSIDFAVRHLGESIKLVVVLGHSGCGAVTAAVDGYLSPKDFVDIAFTHSLRSLVDRIQIAVRGAAKAMKQIAGPKVADLPNYRDMLIEAAVYLNTAVTAFDLQREIRALDIATLPIVYGVYDLTSLRVRALPDDSSRPPTTSSGFGKAPTSADDFATLSANITERLLGHGNPGASGEW